MLGVYSCFRLTKICVIEGIACDWLTVCFAWVRVLELRFRLERWTRELHFGTCRVFFFFILVSYYECHWLLFNFENPRTMPTMWSWLPGTARQLLYSDYSGCTFFFFGSGPDSPMQVVRTAADNWLRPFGVARNFCSSTTIVRRFSSFTIINTSFVLIIAEVT